MFTLDMRTGSALQSCVESLQAANMSIQLMKRGWEIPFYQRMWGNKGIEPGDIRGLDDITKRKVHVDRIIFLSDLCCYTQGDNGTASNCGIKLEAYFGKGATMQSMADRYRQRVNPRCFVYSINLSGHAQSQLRPADARTHLLSGWSEKLLDTIRELEAGQTPNANSGATASAAEAPVIEVLRRRYGR